MAEVQPPGTGWRRLTAWFERDGRRSESFAWAVVGADAIAGLARQAGLEVEHSPPRRPAAGSRDCGHMSLPLRSDQGTQ